MLKNVINDFLVLSPLESFYLYSTDIHRDFCGEIKTIKILFYIDDVSDIDKGPLYVIPGTQFIYDKYSSCIGNNVGWPPGVRNNTGAGFNEYSDYLKENMPKKHLLSNKDSIIFFNNTLLHGSDGNKNETTLLRRALGMTVVVIDRNNQQLMDSVDKIYAAFDIKNKNSSAYLYCEKNKETLSGWLEHFYEYKFNKLESEFNGINDPDGIKLSNSIDRFKHYTEHLENINDEIKNDTIYNCYSHQINNYYF